MLLPMIKAGRQMKNNPQNLCLLTFANSCGSPGGRRGGLPSIGGVWVKGITSSWKSSGFITSHVPPRTPSLPENMSAMTYV